MKRLSLIMTPQTSYECAWPDAGVSCRHQSLYQRILLIRPGAVKLQISPCGPISMTRNAVFLLFTVTSAFSATHAADRPNIVWLVSEDNSVHYLKHFDEHGAPTPRIEALAAHGLTFDHAFSNAPVCSVARTTLATGCYGPRIGTQYHRRSVSVPLPDGMKMFPEYLRNAGYYTANNSKTDYNAIPGKNVWNESSKKASWRKRKDSQPFFYMQSFTVCHESSLHFSANVMATENAFIRLIIRFLSLGNLIHIID